jgi:DNA polymerase III delta prime subunit
VSNGGGAVMAFNPITTAAMKKVLRGVAEAEGAADRVATSTLDSLAVEARGDLRHALLGLQMQCVGRCR